MSRAGSCLFQAFFTLVGISLGITLVVMFHLHSKLFDARCPSINGRTCNNAGVCGEYGICYCDAHYSGEACENTACGGYDEFDGSVCYGRGVCLPPDAEHIPEACKEALPSAANGYVRLGLGWVDPECLAYVDRIWEKIERDEATEDEMASVPTCACHSPYGGRSCLYNMCPKTADFRVCGGNGNVSVGFTDNDTAVGQGCQCVEYVSLKQIIQVVDIEYLTMVREKYAHEFIQGFCGRLRLLHGGRTILFAQNPDAVRCFCDEMHYGEACGYGVCPEINGIVCGGHGHRELGFGVERAVTTVAKGREKDCVPNCRGAGVVLCHGRCDSPESCRTKEAVCPDERPYRCASATCVSGVDQHCDAQFEFGYWNNPNHANFSHAINCSLASMNKIGSLLMRQRKLRLCFGSNAVVDNGGVRLGGETDLDGNRLVGVYMHLIDEGVVSFKYRGVNYTMQGPGYVRMQINATNNDLFSNRPFGPVIINKLQTPRHVRIDPHVLYPTAPLPDIIQARSVEELFEQRLVLQPLKTAMEIVHDPHIAQYSILFLSDPMQVMDISMQTVAFETCVSSPERCLWAKNATQAIHPSIATVRYVSIYLLAQVDQRVWNAWRPESAFWNLHLAQPTPSTTLSFIAASSTSPNVDVRVAYIEYLVERDLVKPCICQPMGKNKTDYDQIFLAQTSRSEVTMVGEYGVGVSVDADGFARIVRGVVTNIQPLMIRDALRRKEMMIFDQSAKFMTKREFALGEMDCDFSIYPARCDDGSCSTLDYVPVNGVHEECFCTVSYEEGLRCTCRDTFGNMEVCVGERDCADLHGGVSVDWQQACFWSPVRQEAYVPRGFKRLKWSEPIWVSTDVQTMPILFEFDFCASNITLQFMSNNNEETRMLERECVGGKEVFRWVHSLDVHDNEWRVNASEPFIATFYKHYGGISIFALSNTIETSASSNNHAATHVRQTDSRFWESDTHVSSLHARIQHTFPVEPMHLVSVYIEFVTVGVATSLPNVTFSVSVLIQGQVQRDKWFTLAKIKEDVINGSKIHTVPIHHEEPLRAIRLFSYFPLAVRSFIPFTDQNCSIGRLVGSPPDIPSRLIEMRNKPPSLLEGCVCNDTCVLQGVLVGKDGVCSDLAHNVNASSLSQGGSEGRGDGWWWCEDGTDCTDCGTNMWSVDRSMSCLSDPTVRRLYQQYASVLTLAELDNVWTIEEFVFLGHAQLSFMFSWGNKTVWRWVKTLCEHECLFHRCKDGTCVNDPRFCEATTFQCRGNGCVRTDLTKREYSCACEKGHGGINCALTECTPGDPETGHVDPYKWCTCNGPSPLKIKPPFELTWGGSRQTFFTDQQVLDINRPLRTRESAGDVGWENVQAEKAPYGIPFLRVSRRTNATIFTNCPYRVRSSKGLYLELEQCVVRRGVDWPYEVLEWNSDCPVWEFETQYDDAPYRCPSGHCVAHERDCYTMNLIHPMCGHGGRCMVDGTCVCDFGKETFLITERLTNLLAIPYAHTASGVTNPVVWGVPNDNRFVDEWCNARNCSQQDCSPPTGCFVGTLELDFVDREFECQEPHNPGKCVVDVHDCKMGQVNEPMICSGNGELRKRDNREEWYCECRNGFGGRACQDYFCQDDAHRIYYSRNQPHTLQPYVDRNGNTLPGRWLGPCGVAIGANPDDASEWGQCCQGIAQLERCERVPCVIGGVSQCVPVEECMGYGRQPKVYVCNGKGRALADGTCLCEKNAETGMGYTYDLAVYSLKGCYKRIQCPQSPLTGRVCNSQPACQQFQNWNSMQHLDYFMQQLVIFAAREGLPLTNRSICERLIDPNELANIIKQQLVNVALETQAEVRAVMTDICVSQGDNSSMPFGMVSYEGKEAYVGVYRQSLRAPFLIPNIACVEATHPFIADRQFSTFYLPSNPTTIPQFLNDVTSFTLSLPEKYFIDIIRVHLLTSMPFILQFTSCQSTTVKAKSDYQWVTVFCMPTYRAFRFEIETPDEWAVHCRNDVHSIFCEQWMEQTCLSIPNGFLQRAGSLQYFNGCLASARCCVMTVPRQADTNYIHIHTTTPLATFDVDEVAIFGHQNTSLPIPTGLAAHLQMATNQSLCFDELVFSHSQGGIGGQGSLFALAIASTFDIATTSCQTYGGVLATGYASAMGAACYANGLNKMCFVNARDRNEIRNPASLEYMLDTACSTWGCYEYDQAARRGYYSDPNDGAQWLFAWHPGQISWQEFYRRLKQQHNDQLTMSAVHKSHYDWAATIAGVTTPACQPTTADLTSCFYGGGDITSPATTLPSQSIPFDVLYSPWETTTYLIPGDNEPISTWNNEETCVVTFFSMPNCGAWFDWAGTCTGVGCDLFGYHWDDLYNGAMKRVVVTPKNYEQIFGVELIQPGMLFDTITPFTKATAPGYTKGYPGGYFNHLGENIQFTASLSIEGNCKVMMKNTHPDCPYSAIYENPNTAVGSIGHSLGAQVLSNHIPGWISESIDRARPFQGRYKCFPSIYPTTKPGVTDHPSYQPHIRPGIDHILGNGTGICGEPLRQYIVHRKHVYATSIKIFPAFEAGKLKTYPVAENNQMNPNTDSFTMGRAFQSFMCSNVLTERVLSLMPLGPNNPDNIAIKVENYISPFINDVPVIPIDATVYFGISSGCTTIACCGCDFTRSNFIPCDGTGAMIRNVKRCSTCMKPQVARYQWLQEFVDGTTFIQDVQFDSIITPALYVRSDSVMTRYDTLPTFSRFFTRISCVLKPSDYLVKFEFDSCLAISRISLTQFAFTPTICSNTNTHALCVRDVLKFAVKLGNQCYGECGPASRTQIVQPFDTAFSLHPKANPVTNPNGHIVLNAYLNGELDALVSQQELIPWDAIRASLSDASVIFAFPEARDFLIRGVSLRPGYVSFGETADPDTWVDMNFHRIFPVDCGFVKSRHTGVSRRVCAASKGHCLHFDDPLTSVSSTMMEWAQMPRILTGALLQADLTMEPKCGVFIDPSSFHVYDDFGGPQPSSNAFQVLRNDVLVLKVLKQNGTWTNTGKALKADVGFGFNLFGKVKSSVSKGFYQLWVSRQSPMYSYQVEKHFLLPEPQRLFIGDNIIHLKNVTSFNIKGAVFGFDFSFMQTGSQLTLYKLLVTTTETMDECRSVHVLRYMEPPPSIISSAAVNECKFTVSNEELSQGIREDIVGTCVCDFEGPHGGPGCDWEATRSSRGKLVCNGYGDDGGLELTPALSKAPLISELGVYLFESSYKCKCIQPGLIFQTVANPVSAFDYTYIIRYDRLPNADLFIEITDIPDTITLPVAGSKVEQICNIESAVLPSWGTGEEVDELLMFQALPIFIDLTFDAISQRFQWKARDEDITVNATSGTLLVDGPCAEPTSEVCRAVNWNNIAFNASSGLTDGRDQSMVYSYRVSGHSISVKAGFTDIVVEVWLGMVYEYLQVTAQFDVASSRSCDITNEPGTFLNTYICSTQGVYDGGISAITLQSALEEDMLIREVFVFAQNETGRVPGWMT